MPTLWVPGRGSRHGDQAPRSRTLRVVPHHVARERASLPLPDVCSRVAPRYEPSGRSTRAALAVGGALGAHWAGRSSCDGDAPLPGPRCVLEEPPIPLSWLKGRVY